MARIELSPLGALVRKHDPDRYFTALFAPPGRREALFTLYAFNHELARAREAVREPFAAMIRLQWWREVAEGARRRHEVAAPLGEALDAGTLHAADLLAMIEAREAEAEPIETLDAFKTYALGAAGGVMVTAARALGMDDPAPLRPWGAAYGVAGLLRSIPAHARQGRCLLPLDLLQEAGLSDGAVIANPTAAALAPVRARLTNIARSWLEHRPHVTRSALAAALPTVLARRDLRRERLSPNRPVRDRVAVLLAALRGQPR